MKTLATGLVVLALGFAGCASQVPIPTAYEKSYQPKMWAAHHWNLLAADVAERLATALGGEGVRVVYIEQPAASSVFSRAFHDLLTTQLMEQGFGVARVPSPDAVTIMYDVNYGGAADFVVGPEYTGTEIAPPDNDIIVNVSVVRGDRYVTRITEIFYVDDTVADEFYPAPAAPPTRLVEVVGS